MLELLRHMVRTVHSKGLIRSVKANAELLSYIDSAIVDDIALKEKIYLLVNDEQLQRCVYGNAPVFHNMATGYKTHCGSSAHCECRRQNHSNKMKSVWQQRTPQQRQHCTASISKLNTAEVQEKAQSTMRARYGVDRAFQSECIRQKARDVYREKTGYDAPLCNPQVRAQIQHNTIQKYGSLMTQARAALTEKYNGNPFSHAEVRRKILETNLKKYGGPAATSCESVRQRVAQTNWERRGCVNPMQQNYSQELNAVLADAQFVQHFHVHGTEWFLQNGMSAATLHKRLVAAGEIEKTQSLPEKQVQTWLDQLNVRYRINDRSKIAPLELDFFMTDHNVAVEVNGVYWHSEIAGNKTAAYHNHKTTQCAQVGVQLLHVWDTEIIRQPEIVYSKLLSKLHMSHKIHARQTQVVVLTASQAREFFVLNHSQGHVNGACYVGLMHNGQLVSAMSFGKPRYSRIADSELLRYASLLNHTVVGGASKLLKHYVNSYSPQKIISYSDRRYSQGNLYEQLNFKWYARSKPSYHYTNDYVNLNSRHRFQKHKLSSLLEHFDPELTEWQNMKANAYDRVWDCGTDTWILECS